MEGRKPEYDMILCKYTFTKAENQEIASEMALAVNEKQNLEDELKAMKDDYKARISRADSTVNSCAHKLNNGYEMRQMECHVHRDFESKMILWERVDNNEIVRERRLTQDELQMELPQGGA